MGGRTVSGVNLDRADRLFDWSSVQVVIAGLGMSGFAAADALLDLDASVLVLDDRDDDDHRDKANLLEVLGASVRLGACLLYTSPSPRDVEESRMPSSA